MAACRKEGGGVEWNGDADAFDRAGLRTLSPTAFARALRSVPPDDWSATEARMRATLDAVQLAPDAEGAAQGHEPTSTSTRSVGMIRRAGRLEAKKRALREEGAERAAGAARPA
jgi:hypothetical protein